MATPSNTERHYKQAKDAAVNAMGGKSAYWVMGSTIRQAFVAQAILQHLTLQDRDNISAEKVCSLLDDLTDMMHADTELQGD